MERSPAESCMVLEEVQMACPGEVTGRQSMTEESDDGKTAWCAGCRLWFSTIPGFISHMGQHETQCLLCRQSASTSSQLMEHYASFHKIDLAPLTNHQETEGGADEQDTHVDHSYFRLEEGQQVACGEEERLKEIVHDEGSALGSVEEVVTSFDILPVIETEFNSDIRLESNETHLEKELKHVKKCMDEEKTNRVGCENADDIQSKEVLQKEKVYSDDSEQISEEKGAGGLSCGGQEGDGMDYEGGEDVVVRTGDRSDKEEEGLHSYDLINGELAEGHMENDDSATFMKEIHLDTGLSSKCDFAGGKEECHREEEIIDVHVLGESDEEQTGCVQNDFRFILGLKHRQMHIANSDLVTDIGLQIFICLHCDFMDSERRLVQHMNTVHPRILQLERTVLRYLRTVPPDRTFPENVTGEEVIRLSEYHKRNLAQKNRTRKLKMQKRVPQLETMGDITDDDLYADDCEEMEDIQAINTGEKKKKYPENREPCLCPECGKILCRKSALRTHILGVHSRSKNHLCEVCGKAFRGANHLSQHRKSHRTKTFSCDLCDFTSDVRMAIFDHQQLHPNKFILCHVCGTVLKSKGALSRHMMVHSESRPFACTVEGCTWRFTSEALCKGHIESHTSLGEFVCLECKRHFRKRHHIRRHLKTVHGKASNSEADKFVAVDAKVIQSTEQFEQIPVTQLSKQHIVITTDEHGTPIFCDQSEELVFDAKSSSLLEVTVKHTDVL